MDRETKPEQVISEASETKPSVSSPVYYIYL